ncbi:MAG: hypothetical protein JSV95_06860, partial [Gemmatimonadota bacterium]
MGSRPVVGTMARRRKPGLSLAAGAALVLVTACGEVDPDDSTKVAEVERRRAGAERATLLVYAVSYPLAYFAERIGGDLVQI